MNSGCGENGTMPILISLDGNIGAGKTTLLESLHEAFPGLVLVKEPVEDWLQMKNERGKSILQLYYDDPKRYAYTFQHTALMTRIRNTRQAIASAPENAVVVCERSILTDRHIFAEMLHNDKMLSPIEWDLYLMWYDLLAEHMKVDGILYINTPPDVCLGRIRHRGRTGEENIQLKYLEQVDQTHKNWIGSTPIPVLTITTEQASERSGMVASLRQFVDQLRSIPTNVKLSS
jgi:deoxyadenosine/deoxycytidine kinase